MTTIASACASSSSTAAWSSTVIPFFERHPLRSGKRADFEKFAQIVWMVDNGCHLTPDGLIEIAEIVQTMNRQKPRHDLIRILRGHTPEVRDTGS